MATREPLLPEEKLEIVRRHLSESRITKENRARILALLGGETSINCQRRRRFFNSLFRDARRLGHLDRKFRRERLEPVSPEPPTRQLFFVSGLRFLQKNDRHASSKHGFDVRSHDRPALRRNGVGDFGFWILDFGFWIGRNNLPHKFDFVELYSRLTKSSTL
jgi:hypothetical protein